MIQNFYESIHTFSPISMHLYYFYFNYCSYFVDFSYNLCDILDYFNNFFYSEKLSEIPVTPNICVEYLYQTFSIIYVYIYQPLYFTCLLFLAFLNIIPNYFFNNSSRIEKELNNIEDNIVFIILLVFFIFYILGFYVYLYNNVFITFIILLYIVLLMVFLIICIPFSLLFNYGFFLPYYLRGSSNIAFFFYEIFLDYVNIVSFFLRISIQFIRIFLILLTIYTYNELYLELNILNNFTLNTNSMGVV